MLRKIIILSILVVMTGCNSFKITKNVVKHDSKDLSKIKQWLITHKTSKNVKTAAGEFVNYNLIATKNLLFHKLKDDLKINIYRKKPAKGKYGTLIVSLSGRINVVILDESNKKIYDIAFIHVKYGSKTRKFADDHVVKIIATIIKENKVIE